MDVPFRKKKPNPFAYYMQIYPYGIVEWNLWKLTIVWLPHWEADSWYAQTKQ